MSEGQWSAGSKAGDLCGYLYKYLAVMAPGVYGARCLHGGKGNG